MTMKKILLNNELEVLQFDKSFVDCNIFHFMTTRSGGISKGAYSSFNLGFNSGDISESVAHNRSLLASGLNLSIDNLIIPHQTHQDNVLCIDRKFLLSTDSDKIERLYGVDALITDLKNVSITVTTADCVPILLYDRKKKVAAAVHAGWKGTQKQILRKTLKTMVTLYCSNPHDIIAGIGPSISKEAFEVGEEVVQSFSEAFFPMENILVRDCNSRKAHIDLWEANRWQLIDEGVSPDNIEIARICTFHNSDFCFSARKLGVKCGRMLAGIIIK